jgi:predicted enzyme related to lactoylglutathione lyase
MPNGFVHIELNTDDVAKAKKFYKKVFDWKVSPMGPGYDGIDVGKGGVGGGMQKKPMANAPTMWLPYVLVDDVKKTVAKAATNGATVMVDFMEVGDMGAIGVFVDPTGAAIGVWEAARKAPKKGSKKDSKKKEKKKEKKKTKKK